MTRDEAYSWRISQYPPADVVARTRQDANPPLYYLVLKSWEWAWGTSPAGLRGLSTFLAVLSVAISYAACVRASMLNTQGEIPWRVRLGALFSAFLVAVHPGHVSAGQTARMYALGTLLAATTSWLLLRSAHTKSRAILWWTAYGLAAAAFGLTHYYAFFTLAAQALFALGLFVLQAPRHGWQKVRTPLAGLALATLVAGLLYIQWIPALLTQIEHVRQHFWIPKMQTEQTAELFWRWCTSLADLAGWEKAVWTLILAVCVAATLSQGDTGGLFFLLQAVLPWLSSIALSLMWDRSILYDRYLVFAQWGLLCYWGVACTRFRILPLGLIVAAFIAAHILVGLHWKNLDRRPALAQVADFLRENALPHDEVWVSGAADVHLVRYYADQAGLGSLRVRCRVSLAVRGHLLHFAALADDDLLGAEPLNELPRRFWKGSVVQGRPMFGIHKVLQRTFYDSSSQYTVTLYDRSQSSAE